jgi:long-subunit acyl-CoA synthetase (AMP-forming)
VWSVEEIFSRDASEVDASQDLTVLAKRKAEDVASIIFTSGTTGRPKGVVLTDRNFTALTARMAALFELRRTDSLLSVLPPHHTFEFSAGLLMPLASGASVTYLEERNPDLISRAFEETPVTSLIGVPAVWESLHRKIMKELEAQGLPVELAVKGLMRLNRWLRDRFGWNFGRWVFRPMHDAVGGRLRYMVSGAAAAEVRDLHRLPRPRVQHVRGLRPHRGLAGAHGGLAGDEEHGGQRGLAAPRHRGPDRGAERGGGGRDHRPRPHHHAGLPRER